MSPKQQRAFLRLGVSLRRLAEHYSRVADDVEARGPGAAGAADCAFWLQCVGKYNRAIAAHSQFRPEQRDAVQRDWLIFEAAHSRLELAMQKAGVLDALAPGDFRKLLEAQAAYREHVEGRGVKPELDVSEQDDGQSLSIDIRGGMLAAFRKGAAAQGQTVASMAALVIFDWLSQLEAK